MNKLPVENYHILGEDGKPLCSHENTFIEKACCSPAHRASSGYIECGCGGRDTVVCENPDCTSIDEEKLPEFNNDCWG